MNGLNAFDVSGANLTVSNGAVFAVVLKSTVTFGDDYLAREVPFTLYASGQAVINSGAGWQTFGKVEVGFDAIFQTRVNPLGTVVGGVNEINGDVKVKHANGTETVLHVGDPVRQGDIVTTSATGSVNIQFADNTLFALSGNAQMAIDKFVYNSADHTGSTFFEMLQGIFVYTSGLIGKEDPDNLNVDTPVGNLGIRGTEFIARRDPCSKTQEVYLIHGQLAVKPRYSGVTNVVDAPATIFYDATNMVTSGLTQAAYDAMLNQINQAKTNPVTFASWLVQYFGCTNNNPSAAANADPDGDGQNNYAEFLARTDPTTNASVFRLVSGAREGDGVRLVWQTHGGITNVVQAASSPGAGYSDISSNIVIPGDADVATNYFDPGAMTNAPARFYRIRLVQ